MGSPCKTVRVNKFNGLHVIILSCDPMKSMRYRGYFLDFTLPALFCRDYPEIRLKLSPSCKTGKGIFSIHMKKYFSMI